MRIAISAVGPSLDAEVDPRFGRCQYFVIADPETMEFEAVDNSSAMAAGGAGISAAQAIADKGVQAVLTGNCGPNAYQVLSSAGIQVITGVSGSVKDAIDGYRSGKFKTSAQANVPDHFGMGSGSGMGMGRGMGGGGGRGMGSGGGRGMGSGGGRGMGSGGGRGMGMGRGMGSGMYTGFDLTPPTSPLPQPESADQELKALKEQTKAMAQQLNDIQRRIADLEKKRE
jgi:predicted Fe-Mo cluster-binding NifX family protein